jgi:methyl-accepting chemotaxis protein
MTESLYEMASQTRQMTVEQTTCVRRVLEAMASMATLIDQNLHSSHQILSITEELSAQSDVLLHSVANFKLN